MKKNTIVAIKSERDLDAGSLNGLVISPVGTEEHSVLTMTGIRNIPNSDLEEITEL